MNAFALIPFGIFAVFYVTLGIVARDFYRVPMTVAFLVAIASALFLQRGKKFGEKIESLAKGMGEPDIMLMCLIFILAGAFAAVAKASTAVDSASSLSDKKYQNQIEKERPSGRSFFIFPFQTLFCPKLAQLRYFCRTSVY